MLIRYFFWTCGALSLALGIIGIFLPILPTTPFVLLAAACWAKASPRFHRWLHRHPRFGPMVQNWERTAAGKILRIQYDDALVLVFVLAVSRKMVDRRSIGRILFLCGGLDVAASGFMSEGRLKIVFRRPSLIMALPVPFCIGNVNFR